MRDYHAAKRLPRDPGESGWLGIIGEVPSYPGLSGSITADVAVIGAGFTGLTAARQLNLHDPSCRVVVLEAERVASGPAGRNSGFMVELPHDLGSDNYATDLDSDKRLIDANLEAREFALETAEEFGMPEEAVDACGRINGAVGEVGERHNRDYARHLDQLGQEYLVFSARDMEEVTGSSFYAGGMFLPGGVMLQPALYITQLAKGTVEDSAGKVSIFESSPVDSLWRHGSDWVINTRNGLVTAPMVVLAVNGHAESFGFFKRRLMHVFTYASMTEVLDLEISKTIKGMKKWGITPSDPMGTTIRRVDGIGGNRIVVRNRWSFDPSMEVTEARVRRFAKSHRKSFLARYPQAGSVAFEYQWAGRLCLSTNSAPAFGFVDENLLAACCQNGLGTTKGTLAGMAAADLVAGVQSDAREYLETSEKPARLPPWPVASIGARSVIRLREYRARGEL